jgi:SAM-dependent methyltransferase
MLYLGQEERKTWKDFADQALETGTAPGGDLSFIRPGLIPAFHFYIGTLLLSSGRNELGEKWINAGIPCEPGGLFSNAFLASYLKRNKGQLVSPGVIFEDPAPYVHFNNTPVLADSRMKFLDFCAHGLPKISEPLRIMDIGCGHGKVLVDLLQKLQKEDLIGEVGEIFLIDPSEKMLKLACDNVTAAFPGATIRTSQSRIQGLPIEPGDHYHIALASLSIHHIPYEIKLLTLKKLKQHIDWFILFELDGNNDSPERNTPECALSVYQLYGSVIDFVFSYDAPIELAIASIDRFLMAEAVYFFTVPRENRTDFHMLRSQWHQIFTEGLGNDFTCICDSTCYGDENVAIFTMIYGKA